jgi:adenylate kinase family enzyme
VRRVCILGASGSGKTTLASRLARRLGIEHIELDALYHGPNWTHPTPEDFRATVEAIAARDAWVIDGGYISALGDLVPRAADTVVWLDLPLASTLARLARRSLRRLALRTELWNGNRETLGGLLWQPDSLLRWTLKRHARFRQELPPLFRTPPYAAKALHRLRSQREIDRFLATA